MNCIKFLIAALLLVGISFAKNSNVLSKGKYLLTYEKEYEDVWTYGSAKSTKTKCSVRVDLKNMLVGVGDCDIEKISFYTRDSMWLGSLTHSLLKSDFEANYNYRDISFSFDIKAAAYMQATFNFIRQHATEDNLYKVTCPKGENVSIDEYEMAFCYKPYTCAKGEYSIDSITCAKLPKNSKRLKKEGFECNAGFSLYKTDSLSGEVDTAFCYKPYACAKGEYSIDSIKCATLPAHAQRLKKEGFECDAEFSLYKSDSLSDEIDTAFCYKPYACANDEYSIDSITCAKLPEHASRLQTDGFVCDTGFVAVNIDDSNICEARAMCDSLELYVENSNKCFALPAHAEWITDARDSSDFVCDSSYIKNDRECLEIVNCSENEYRENFVECKNLPAHAHALENGWECNDGYKKYYGDYGECTKVCSQGEYKISDFECAALPAHAHASNDYWECDSGYDLVNGACEKQTFAEVATSQPIDNNYDNEELEQTQNAQFNEPSKSSGLKNDLSLEIGAVFASQVNNVDDGNVFFLEGELGLEWLFGSSFSFGPAVAISRVYSSHPDDLSFYSTRLKAALMFVIGEGDMRYYGRPFMSANLQSSVSYESSSRAYIEYEIPAITGGLELGMRFGNILTDKIAFDVYFSMSSTMFKDDYVSEGIMIMLGLRLIAF